MHNAAGLIPQICIPALKIDFAILLTNQSFDFIRRTFYPEIRFLQEISLAKITDRDLEVLFLVPLFSPDHMHLFIISEVCKMLAFRLL